MAVTALVRLASLTGREDWLELCHNTLAIFTELMVKAPRRNRTIDRWLGDASWAARRSGYSFA